MPKADLRPIPDPAGAVLTSARPPSADRPATRVPVPRAQQRLWLADQLTEHHTAFLTRVFVRLSGDLDVPALRGALGEIVSRHEVLRTSLSVEDGEVAGYLRPAGEFALGVEDVAPEGLDGVLRAEMTEPLDVTHGIPVRARLLRLGARDHALLVTTHHFAFDEESAPVLLRELSAFYAARHDGGPALPPLPRQFRELMAEEEARHDAGKLASLVAQRRAALGDRGPFELAGDRPRPTVRTGKGALRHAFELPAETVRRLTRVGCGQAASLYMVLLAGVHTVLYRYTGRADVTTGSSSSTRVTPESDRLIGPFLTMLTLPGDLSRNPAFTELVGRTRDVVLDAYEARPLPFETLVAELGEARDPARTPLFQILVDFTVPSPAPRIGDLDVERIAGHNGGAKYDLSVEFRQVGDRVRCDLEWDTALYDEPTVVRFGEHLRAVLVAVADDPSLRLDDVPMLAAGEIAGLRALGTPEPAAAPARCLHDLFRAQVARTPHATAVTGGDASLTYAELAARATEIAHGLVALGVGPDVPVGVLLDRSVDMVATVLGILLAGGAYLPIDPAAPPARVRRLLGAANAVVCVADRPGGDGCRFSTAGELVRQAERGDGDLPAVSVDHLCAVYFTSGSTGEPKAVACTHRGWYSQLANLQDRYELAPGEPVLLKTPLSFDDVAREIFWPLMVGARIVVLPPGLHRDPRALLAAAIEHRLVWLQFVPGMLAPFLDEIRPEHEPALRVLRHVVSDGDRLRPETVAVFHARLGAVGCCLNNHWGTTEASIDSTHHRCGPADARHGTEAVALGRPMADNDVYVLDPVLQPVPRGAVGELCIGGPVLARGYLGDPGRTARAFVPHPWRPGERLYRTGDTGRIGSDGNLRYRGRRDHQVKVRGVRIELGEIEAAVRAFPGTTDAVVTTWEPVPGDHQLAAYAVVTGEPDAAARGGLREFLVDHLSPAMVPTALILLPRLPRTPGGKVDRNALPAPHPDALRDTPFTPPGTDAEQAVAEIWAAVLGVPRLGADDDFFTVGGHSLLVVRAVNRMRDAFGVDVPLRLVFEHPTVRAAAGEIEKLIIAELEAMSDDEADRLAVEAGATRRTTGR
ncbi:non-ribosomal peptide synthetase [Amycolatopsis sp. NPDC003861]